MVLRRNPTRFAVILFSVFLITARTEATSITGTIGFAGATSPRNWLETSVFDNIDIFNDVATVLCAPVLIPCSGTFADYEGGLATYNDFSLDALGEPMSPLWTFNGFSFYLSAIDAQFTVRSDYGIVLRGSGKLFGPPGYESTRALWSFSANSYGGDLPRFSSTTTPVPDDGGTLCLFISALLVIAVIGRGKLPRVA